MWRRTYYGRLLGEAVRAEERAFGLELEEARKRFPGLFTPERGFPRDPTKPAKRSERFFTPRALAALNARKREPPVTGD
jgi:hypothetical protein